MIAFGLPLRTVLAMTTVEAAVIGVLGTIAGLAGGYALLSWLVSTTIPGVMPELGVTAALTGGSIVAALLLGIAAVSIAPLFTLRRMRRMDIPSTLRLVE
jgi:putative ABC transport system permease protein